MNTVIFCGSRDWGSNGPIMAQLRTLSESTVVVEGGATGADEVTRTLAKKCHLFVVTCHAPWDWLHKGAGPARNRFMLELAKPSHVYAFVQHPGYSPGTYGMIELAREAGVPVTVTFIDGTVQEMPAIEPMGRC